MSFKPKHILTKNLYPAGPRYFNTVVIPSLEETKIKIKPVIKQYEIAGKKIQIYLYGDYVTSYFPISISHHEEPLTDNVDLTIHAWDGASANTKITAPWETKEETENKDFLGVYLGGEESLNFYDRENKVGYFWTQDARKLPDWVLGAPFRSILHWFLGDFGIHLMHGAVIGENGKSILLTARSGSGKSTTALSCMLSGMDYLSDDYIAVESKDKVLAHSLYHSAKVTDEGLELFPELKQIVLNKGFKENEKAVMVMSDIFPDQVKKISEIEAIFIPRITGKETRIVKASKIEAMLAIAPTTLLQLPMAETNKLNLFKEILDKIPCYTLELGPEIREIPKIIKDFLKKSQPI